MIAMVKTSYEDTYPWTNSDRWGVTISAETLRWVIKAWNEGKAECISDRDNLRSENEALKRMLNILEKDNEDGPGGTEGTPIRQPAKTSTSTGTSKKKSYNKLAPDQYNDLREASATIVKKCRTWLGTGEDRGKINAICRRYLHMAGYSGQTTKQQPEFANLEESKQQALMTLSDASDKTQESRDQHVLKILGESTDLEKELREALTANNEAWAFILPANINALSNSASAPVQPPTEVEPPQTSGTGKIQVKAIQELKPKLLLTQNMSRQDMLTWERQMRSYFKASIEL